MATTYNTTTGNCVQVVEKLENGAKSAKNMLENGAKFAKNVLENGALWCII